jgi:predicted negative regulator of RcsB-dependent stress response
VRSDVRHQLKRDKFAETTTETMHWAVEHRSRLILYGAVVLVVLVLAISFYAVRRSQEQTASLALANAFETYGAPVVPAGTPPQPGVTMFNSNKDRATAANADFRKIADKYSTQSGKLARYMAGVTYNELGDYPNAEKELKDVAGSGSGDLSNLAKFALASVYRQSNRDADAINEYQEIEAHPSPSVGKSMADLELASVYSAKQPDKAKILLQQIAKDNPNTAIAQLATEKLAAIK